MNTELVERPQSAAAAVHHFRQAATERYLQFLTGIGDLKQPVDARFKSGHSSALTDIKRLKIIEKHNIEKKTNKQNNRINDTINRQLSNFTSLAYCFCRRRHILDQKWRWFLRLKQSCL